MASHSITICSSQYTVYVDGDSASVKPYNMLIQDAVDEMMGDIGEFSLPYLKELFCETSAWYPTMMARS